MAVCVQSCYELLHKERPREELDFYLSYAEKDKEILEVMCGSGRFLVPFMDRGFDICGIDLSAHMLERLKRGSVCKRQSRQIFWNTILQTGLIIFLSPRAPSLFLQIRSCAEGSLKS